MASSPEITFKELGVSDQLCDICTQLNWINPTKIQAEVLPLAFEGKDIIGLAETGSGKTGAFALPIVQDLLQKPHRLFALILTPTRELAFQISDQFEAIGSSYGLKSVVIVGGIDKVPQAMALSQRPHIIIATPGRLVDHLENTKGFDLNTIKYLVFDEADRILDMDFEEAVKKIVRVLPRERRTYLFSATMTTKVRKLQNCSLRNPVKVEVSSKYQTVDTLKEYYVFIPFKFKLFYLAHLLSEFGNSTFMVFCSTCSSVQRISLIFKYLGFSVTYLHGQMPQENRLVNLNKFRASQFSILVSTDVASRGLDIPHVDIVINFDIPTQSKSYIHRVGRTARAGKSGKSITFVTQYDVELFQKIEKLLGKKIDNYPIDENEVMALSERVNEAERVSKTELKEIELKGRNKRKIMATQDSEEGAETRINIPAKRHKQINKRKRIHK